MYQYLQNPKNLARILDALLVCQITLYISIVLVRYHVRDFDPLIMNGWADLLQTLCFAFVTCGSVAVLLFLTLLQSLNKKALFRIHRFVLVAIVVGLVVSGNLVVSWINGHAGTSSGGWPFVRL